MRYFLCILVFCSLLGACSAHVKPVSQPPAFSGSNVPVEKDFTVVTLTPFAPAFPLSPGYLESNFANVFKPACRVILPAGQEVTESDAMEIARKNKSDYVLLLRVDKWESGTFSGIDVAISATIIEVSNNVVVAKRYFKKRKSVWAIGYFAKDPWRFIEDDVSQWMKGIFYIPRDSELI